jgi:hypothetical protein
MATSRSAGWSTSAVPGAGRSPWTQWPLVSSRALSFGVAPGGRTTEPTQPFRPTVPSTFGITSSGGTRVPEMMPSIQSVCLVTSVYSTGSPSPLGPLTTPATVHSSPSRTSAGPPESMLAATTVPSRLPTHSSPTGAAAVQVEMGCTAVSASCSRLGKHSGALLSAQVMPQPRMRAGVPSGGVVEAIRTGSALTGVRRCRSAMSLPQKPPSSLEVASR